MGTRIQGALRNLGHRVARITVATVLKDNGIPPAPDRPSSWRTFLRAHWRGDRGGRFLPHGGLPTTRFSCSISEADGFTWRARRPVPSWSLSPMSDAVRIRQGVVTMSPCHDKGDKSVLKKAEKPNASPAWTLRSPSIGGARSMGRAFILWLLGVPTSLLVILWLVGFFH
jgi:hypothetical protein